MPLSSRQTKMQEAVTVLLVGMGLDPTEPGLLETPRRVVGYLEEFSQPQSIELILGDGFDAPDTHNMVAQSNIPFRMACEHHLLPAMGTASIGYVPGKRVVGLSKLTRVVQAIGTSRPSLQEKITDEIAQVLADHLEPKGVIVVTRAEHACMACRGVNSPGVITTVSSIKGIFIHVPAARQEFFRLIGGQNG